VGYRKLGRRSDHRRAMLRNIVTSLLREERIETTEPKAKELRSIAEKIISLGKKGDLYSRRQAMKYLTDETVLTKVFSELSERYSERSGGYTRMVKTDYRQGDAASMVLVELLK